MRHNRIRLAAALGGLLLLAACGGGSNTTGPSNNSGPLTADINGSHWTAVHASVTTTQNIVSIGAADQSGTGIGMAFTNMGVGTYDIAQNISVTFSYTNGLGGQSWAASVAQGSGAIQVDTLTAHRITGTFHFVAPGFTGNPVPTSTTSVTNGKFAISY